MQNELNETELAKAQINVNNTEAASPNIWVSGARPAAMWVCVFGMAWQFVVMPILLFINAEFAYQIHVPIFDTASLITMLSGMLGLGAMRSFDKLQSK